MNATLPSSHRTVQLSTTIENSYLTIPLGAINRDIGLRNSKEKGDKNHEDDELFVSIAPPVDDESKVWSCERSPNSFRLTIED